MNWTETDILAKGRVPDGAGGYRLPGERDFDNGGVEADASALRPGADHLSETRAADKPGNAIPSGLCSRPSGYPSNSRSSDRPVVNPRPAIRVPKCKGPNVTESRYGDILRVRYQEPHVVLYEPLAFHLRSGALYSPDWVVMQGMTIIACYEVKGEKEFASHARSVLAWKSAAQEWPMILWGWAKWKNREWNETEINPVK